MVTAFNVIVFGEAGAGKSSLINMICESPDLTPISSDARGCTFNSSSYSVTLAGKLFKIHDTAGLDEGEGGHIPTSEAIVKLYSLVKSLDTGVSLLIFCMRGPRIKDVAHKNWRLFHKINRQSKVPITIAITGLEAEDNMDEWWPKNKGAFQAYGMNPAGIVCITTTRGKHNKNGSFKFDKEYEESKLKVWKLIRSHHLKRPWRVAPVQWFCQIITTTYESRDWCKDPKEIKQVTSVAGEGIQQLVSKCEMSQEQATELGRLLVNV
ncbi:hypothetical protein BDQ12DRAFT_111449 [Crucibulum laeve]|uniref:G domain-containing protein n=1 Tax=Crucibulum laeve TaxID=68775 RepID=A0A5C3M2P6_9AGAR|nr:hypothetical protein BDQ12DRAFT_111449 [Crucibulum laeve]